jgi:hypothetical protein
MAKADKAAKAINQPQASLEEFQAPDGPRDARHGSKAAGIGQDFQDQDFQDFGEMNHVRTR